MDKTPEQTTLNTKIPDAPKKIIIRNDPRRPRPICARNLCEMLNDIDISRPNHEYIPRPNHEYINTELTLFEPPPRHRRIVHPIVMTASPQHEIDESDLSDDSDDE